MPTTVLYHKNCTDGFGAALACWQHFGDGAQYSPVQYGQPCQDIPTDHNVYIVDFSYPAELLLQLLAARIGRRKRGEAVVTVLDHHASAQRDLEYVQRMALPGMTIRFDMEESGASLTWKHLSGIADADNQESAMPSIFCYLRDRDLWRWALPNSREISVMQWAEVREFPAWQRFADALDRLEPRAAIVAQGTAVLRYQRRLVEEQAARAVTGVIGGFVVPFVNATTLFSEVGDYLCTTQPAIPFCAYYFDREDGQRQWGLRGHGKVDLSVVAKQYDGGGHFNAAGFVTGQSFLPRSA